LVAVTTLLAYFLLSSLDMRYGWQEKIKQAQTRISMGVTAAVKQVDLDKFNRYLIASITLIYFGAVLKYAINMPFWDDYRAILGFLNDFINSDFTKSIQLLFSQHNEHRIVFVRLIEIIQFKVTGEVNFLYLTILGNIGWLLVFIFLWKHARQRGITTVEFFPVVLIMFSFSHYELMTWAMASLQQYYQILFSLLAIYFLVKKNLLISFLFMIISIFTGGGGLVLIPIFALYFVTQKNIKDFILTLVMGAGILLLYFVLLEYSKPGHHPNILALLSDPALLLSYMLAFVGNMGKTKTVSSIFGVLFFMLSVFAGKKTYKWEPFLFWSILLVPATAFITALSRAGFGVEQALSSRYTIYSLLLASLVYLSYILIYKNRKVYFVGLFVGLFSFTLWFNYGAQSLQHHNDRLKTELLFPSAEVAEKILKKSEELGVFSSRRSVKMPGEIINVPNIDGE